VSWEKFKIGVFQVIGTELTRWTGKASRGKTVATLVATPTLRAIDESSAGLMQDFKEDPMNVQLIINSTHSGIMYGTPDKYKQDVNAFIYYGTLGLIDPTLGGEVKIYRMKGWGVKGALGLTLGRALIGFTFIMWLVDPEDRREGGQTDSRWYQWLQEKYKYALERDRKIYEKSKKDIAEWFDEVDDAELVE